MKKNFFFTFLMALCLSVFGNMGADAQNDWLAKERTRPEVISTVSPIYPEGAKSDNAGGRVVLKISINSKGEPFRPEVVKTSGDPRLDQAAVDAVLQWKFKPATVKGIAEVSDVQIPFVFELMDPPEEEEKL